MTDINTLLLYIILVVTAFGVLGIWKLRIDILEIRGDLKRKRPYKNNYLRGSVDYKGRNK